MDMYKQDQIVYVFGKTSWEVNKDFLARIIEIEEKDTGYATTSENEDGTKSINPIMTVVCTVQDLDDESAGIIKINANRLMPLEKVVLRTNNNISKYMKRMDDLRKQIDTLLYLQHKVANILIENNIEED